MSIDLEATKEPWQEEIASSANFNIYYLSNAPSSDFNKEYENFGKGDIEK